MTWVTSCSEFSIDWQGAGFWNDEMSPTFSIVCVPIFEAGFGVTDIWLNVSGTGSVARETVVRVDLGFSVADGEYVGLSFLEGELILRFTDWREQAVEHRFIEAMAFRWSAQPTIGTPSDDETYEVLNSSWLLGEIRAEGHSEQNGFAHYVLCFNASKVLEVISRRCGPWPLGVGRPSAR